MFRHFTKEEYKIIFKKYERLRIERTIKIAINDSRKLAFIKNATLPEWL
ncbi:hypothetical protein QLQ80_02585 [Mycoplasma sp. M5725]|uniref:Uncharacterized protein n=1 Tax=Mycoplasma phocimorsus TaxID=3045839 RepID=A0AAJ1PSY1_9MOLU|nr:hypothetical protein [Mycoplasma phocimorsus]MDJ1645956.1 hypothetical protein [Mycoplasma phocimorsus]